MVKISSLTFVSGRYSTLELSSAEIPPRLSEHFMRNMVRIQFFKPMSLFLTLYVGEVFRFAPDELSFSSGAAWKDIYGPQKSGAIFKKDSAFYITNDKYVNC